MHKSATEKYAEMQKYKHLPKPKPCGPMRPPQVLGFCAQMPKKNNKMYNYVMITKKAKNSHLSSKCSFNCCTSHEQTITLNYKMPLKINTHKE